MRERLRSLLPLLFWATLLVVLALALAPGGPGGGRVFTDKGLHFLAFATLAALGVISGVLKPSWRASAFWLATAIGIEIAQGVMNVGRDPSGLDACASFAGAMFGLFVARGRDALNVRDTGILAASVLFASGVVDLGYRALRGPVTHALLARAFTETDAAPWPGAPAHAYAALTLEHTRTPIFIVDRATPRALALAPGLWPGRKPGDAGVTILMGHRNAAFRALGPLETGASLTLTTRDGARFDYRVTRRDIVKWDDSRLYPDAPGEQLALVTCWPVEATEASPWRLVVYARRDVESVSGIMK